MSARWFRFYTDALRNPKVARLSDREYRVWTELLAVAAENDGIIPPLNDLKHLLMRRLDHLSSFVNRLIRAHLIDVLDNGFTPHNWAKFQYKSDVSTDRVQKFRAKRNVSETAPDTDTESETDRESADALSHGGEPADQVVDLFPDDPHAKPPPKPKPKITADVVKEQWNLLAGKCGLSAIKVLSDTRRDRVNALIKKHGVEDWTEVWAAIERSSFLTGGGDSGWHADFDWITKPANFLKTLEGSYDRQAGTAGHANNGRRAQDGPRKSIVRTADRGIANLRAKLAAIEGRN